MEEMSKYLSKDGDINVVGSSGVLVLIERFDKIVEIQDLATRAANRLIGGDVRC